MKLRNRKGLTLVECIIAMVLLAITLSSSMGFYFYSMGVMQMAMRKKVAIEMASQYLESQRANPTVYGFVVPLSPSPCAFKGGFNMCSVGGDWDISIFSRDPIGNSMGGTRFVTQVSSSSGFNLMQVLFQVKWWEPQIKGYLTTSVSTYQISP